MNRTFAAPVMGALILAACAEPRDLPVEPASLAGHDGGPRMTAWSPATPITELNTPTATEGCPFITRDGVLYFASNRTGGFGGLDLYVSRWDSETQSWGSPENLGSGINTADNEQCPLVLNGNKEMIFVSNRPGGLGGLDLWVAHRHDHRDDLGWGSPANLTVLNSSSAEFGPGAYEEEDEATVIYFNSNRPGGAGGQDLYVSSRPKAQDFASPVPVTELNTASNEEFAAVGKDGREIFFSSNRPGGHGALDLWRAARESTAESWGPATNLGPNVNSSAAEGRSAISWDGLTLYFHSNRNGSVDLFTSTRARMTGQ